MAHAKSGAWWENEGQRALANNSVAYRASRMGTFMREWLALYDSKSESVASSTARLQTYKLVVTDAAE